MIGEAFDREKDIVGVDRRVEVAKRSRIVTRPATDLVIGSDLQHVSREGGPEVVEEVRPSLLTCPRDDLRRCLGLIRFA
jgi:hypothetical protein